MSRLLSFVSGLFAAVSLIFLALSVVVVGPFAYAGYLRRTPQMSELRNCRRQYKCVPWQDLVCD